MKKVLLAIIFLVSFGGNVLAADQCDVEVLNSYFELPVEVTEMESVSDIEKIHMTTIYIDGQSKEIPFGYNNSRWEKLKSLRKEGDCIVYFNTSPETWEKRMGSRGYILLRKGEPIYGFLTAIN